jgi:hypothetical protein
MCEYCGCETNFRTGYVCCRCGKIFCIDCRMPEVHHCDKQLEQAWSKYAMNMEWIRSH